MPQFGAADYWYVDPRAGGVPSPAPQQQFGRSPLGPYAEPTPIPGTQEAIPPPREMTFEDWQRFKQLHRQFLADQQEAQRSERTPAQMQEAMILQQRYPGMLEYRNIDDELAEATGTFTVGDRTYILPTQIEGTPLTRRETLERFFRTGEHGGSFIDVPSARGHENLWWPPTQPNI